MVAVRSVESQPVNRKLRLYSLNPLAACAWLLVAAACGQQPESEPAAEAPADAAAAAKIPVTTESEEARAEYLKGRELLDNLHVAEAHAAFEDAAAADPDFAMAHAMSAQSSPTAADFFDAVGKAKTAAAGASDGEQLFIEALVAGSENDIAGQRAALQELVAAYPKDERSHNALAVFLFGQQDFDSAIEHFKHAVGINPDYAPAYNLLGYAYRSLDDLDNARSAFETYVSLIPDEPNPYDSYAELLMEMGEYDASIENYRKALQYDKHFATSYSGISINHSLKGETDMALAAAKEQLAAARTYAERQAAMFQSAVTHLFAGNNEAAMGVCEAMLVPAEEAGDHAALGGIHEYMGDIMSVAGDPVKGTEHYAHALQHRQEANLSDANKAQAERTHLFKLAIAAVFADDVEAASARAAEYAAAAEVHGTTFEKRRVHELAGYLAAMNDDAAGAASHLAQANQLEPIVLYWSAVANKDAGNTEKAIELAERAAKRNTLSPNLPFFRQEAVQLAEELSGG